MNYFIGEFLGLKIMTAVKTVIIERKVQAVLGGSKWPQGISSLTLSHYALGRNATADVGSGPPLEVLGFAPIGLGRTFRVRR